MDDDPERQGDIQGGGGFWPPFAMAIAGGVLLSTVVSFNFVPPMFSLMAGRRAKAAPAIHGRTAKTGRLDVAAAGQPDGRLAAANLP